jgi:hypothetical protein
MKDSFIFHPRMKVVSSGQSLPVGLKDSQRTKVQEEWSNNTVQEEVDLLHAKQAAQMQAL